jgi:hypothetical protein
MSGTAYAVDVKVLNRRICSYDVVEIPRDAYTVTEDECRYSFTTRKASSSLVFLPLTSRNSDP